MKVNEGLYILCAVFVKPNWCKLYSATVDCKGNRLKCIKSIKIRKKSK